MARLHELLAAEKVPTAAWNALYEETLKKLKNPTHYFEGHSKSLRMLEERADNSAVQDMAREEKPVTTTVFETLEYALSIFGKSEDLQYQKHVTDQKAHGSVVLNGVTILVDLPVDELLGLEVRLTKLRELFGAAPTLDATKHWVPDYNTGEHVWMTKYPEETTKTEKQLVPVVMSPATKEHPAQVQPTTKDSVVGKFTTVRRSGAITAAQKAEAIKRVDELLVAVKQARMRANETTVEGGSVAKILIPLLLEPFTETPA